MISQKLTTFGMLTTLVLLPLLAAPADAEIYFSDDFNDPVASKGKWEVITGDWQVADGVYHQTSTADPWLAVMVAADKWKKEWQEYTVEFNVKPLTTGDAPVNVLFRVQDPAPKVWADRNGPATHMYRWIVNGYTNTESRPYIYDGGTATMLAQTKNTLEVGTWYRLTLVVTKTTLTGYVNDTEMFKVEHAKWTDGRVGLQAYSGKMDFDDFVVHGPGYVPAWLLKAKKPDPANGAVGVQMPLFRWTAGEGAVFHNVYLGTTPELGPAQLVSPRSVLTMFYHMAQLQPGTVYYWRVDELGNDGATLATGDLWSFVAQDVKAYYPTPTDQSNNVVPAPTLTWLAGLGAIQHHLYFGDSRDAVTQGAAGTDKGMQAQTTFTPGALEPLTKYCWRVDETIAGGAIKTGAVWSFTTALPVEDFEAYTDKAGEEIFSTWIDGYLDKSSGSTVGKLTAANGTYAETVIIHGGKQSMPMDYNNLKAPFYSEAVREFAPTQDWTVSDANTLALYVRGAPGNKTSPLYVAVEDASKKAATVIHPNAAAVTTVKWAEWRIPLNSFTGVNLARVKKVYIGVGDKAKPAAGSNGTIYVDDIRLLKP